MNRRRFVATVMVLITLLLSVGGAAAQDPFPTGERPSTGTVSIEAAVNSRISYQGVLKESGAPVTGSRDMTFRLYSDDGCTTQVGSAIVKSGVQVTDGLFSVELDVTQDDFDGQGLWLEVDVGGTGIGCREILPVPYALSLRPGARIVGEAGVYVESQDTTPYSSAVIGYSTASDGETYGVYGEAASEDGVGVVGYATGHADTYGVYGHVTSPSGRGVMGHASSITGTTFGLYGLTNSDEGRGVFGYATADSGATYGVMGVSESQGGKGVYAQSTAESGPTYGVYAVNSSDEGMGVYAATYAGSGTTYGVYGETWSDSGRGVYGESHAITGTTYGVYGQASSNSGRGVFGFATAISGTTYGVYGRANSDDGLGVYGYASAITGTTYGVYGEVSSGAGTAVFGIARSSSGTTYGVRGVSGSADGYGVYGENSQGGYAGYFEGDVGQDRATDGLVKAAVYADCGTSSAIQRSFNNVQGTVTISATATTGVCAIDWGFQVSDRFWVASAASNNATFVTCEPGDTANEIRCACYDHSAIAVNESIIVLIY